MKLYVFCLSKKDDEPSFVSMNGVENLKFRHHHETFHIGFILELNNVEHN